MIEWLLAQITALVCLVPFMCSAGPTEVILQPPVPPENYRFPYVENERGMKKRFLRQHKTGDRSYYVYVPRHKGNRSEPRPLIVLLHGAKRTGASMIDMWRDVAVQNDIILVAPNSKGAAWHLKRDPLFLLDDIIAAMQERHNIDQRRIYLFGHSSGANLSLYHGFADRGKTFAAIALHAGALSRRFIDASDGFKKPGGAPIGIFIGEQDKSFPLPAVRKSAEVMNSLGYPTTLYVLKRHNHWYYTIGNYINLQAWKFLRQHQL